MKSYMKLEINDCLKEKFHFSGIIYAIGLLLTTSIQSVMLAKYFYEMYLIGIWVRSSLTSSIYRKSLKVSPQGKAESTTGKLSFLNQLMFPSYLSTIE